MRRPSRWKTQPYNLSQTVMLTQYLLPENPHLNNTAGAVRKLVLLLSFVFAFCFFVMFESLITVLLPWVESFPSAEVLNGCAD